MLALSFLGTWSISYAAVPIGGFATDKTRALLAYLAVESDRAHERAQLAALLWPGDPRRRALGSLSQALARARRTLAPCERAVGRPLLLANAHQIQLNRTAPIALDTDQFLRWSAGCPQHLGQPSPSCAACVALLDRAVELYRGPLLHGFCLDGCPSWDAWLQGRREQLHAQLLAALATLAGGYEQADQGEQALATWLRLIQAEPWHEEAHRALMRLLAQRGQRAAALAQYERCRQVLAEELGIAPEPRTQALGEAIRSGASFDGWPSAQIGPTTGWAGPSRSLAVPQAAPLEPLELLLLGRFDSSRSGTPLANYGGDKARALLAYLAVESDRAHRRDHLATLFWPNHATAQARRNLSQTLIRLRRALEEPPDAPPLVLADTHQLQFNRAAPARVDVAELLALVEALRQHPHEPPQLCRLCLRRAEQAARLWRGPFLEGLDLDDCQPWDEWRSSRRDQLHALQVGLLLRLAAAHAAVGAHEAAIGALRRLLQAEPWHEEAQRRLIGLLAASGQRAAAMAQYEACQAALFQHFGMQPDAATRALYERLRATTPSGGPAFRAASLARGQRLEAGG